MRENCYVRIYFPRRDDEDPEPLEYDRVEILDNGWVKASDGVWDSFFPPHNIDYIEKHHIVGDEEDD